MSNLWKQNKGANTGGHRAKELSVILPQVPQADIDKCKSTEYHDSRSARRIDAEPITRTILCDLLALYVFFIKTAVIKQIGVLNEKSSRRLRRL